MNHSNHNSFDLRNGEFDLLVWSIPNEVINGFEVNNFEEVIGTSKDQVKAIANGLRSRPKSGSISIDRDQALILRNALAVVLQELGVQEFQTRTGFGFQNGEKILNRLNDFIQDPN